jgi:hypothetical protein
MPAQTTAQPAAGAVALSLDDAMQIAERQSESVRIAEAAVLRARGYTIGAIGNASRSDFAHSRVMSRPGFRAEAQRLARDVGLGVVAPLDGLRPRQLRGARLVIVLGD